MGGKHTMLTTIYLTLGACTALWVVEKGIMWIMNQYM